MERRSSVSVGKVSFVARRISSTAVVYDRVVETSDEDPLDIPMDIKPRLPTTFDPSEGFEHCAICGFVYPLSYMSRVKGKWYCGQKGHSCVRDTEEK